MSAMLRPAEVRFEPMCAQHIDAVLALEQQAHGHPWSRANFVDTLEAPYHAQLLMAGDVLVGYCIALIGVDEVHLLNVAVAPLYQRQGWGHLMLDALALWSRARGAQWLWLEVRRSNPRARRVYEMQGYRQVGERKGYYPAGQGEREDAVVMSLKL